MLEEEMTKIGEKLENLQKEEQEQTVKRSLWGLTFVGGIVAGSVDTVLMGGVPYFSIGIPAYDAVGRISSIPQGQAQSIDPCMFTEDEKEFVKEIGKMNTLAYALGAAIPFAVKFHNEIMSFMYQVADKFS